MTQRPRAPRPCAAPLGIAEPLLADTPRLVERGWSDRSIHSLVRLAEEAAGVELRLQPFRGRELLPERDGAGEDDDSREAGD